MSLQVDSYWNAQYLDRISLTLALHQKLLKQVFHQHKQLLEMLLESQHKDIYIGLQLQIE